MRRTIALALLSLAGCTHAPAATPRDGVVSIDYCADQMVLGLLPQGQIKAVSVESDSDKSFAAPRAAGIPRLRPQLEEIVRLRPAVVVRSYGGAPRLDRQLAAMGIRVVQLGFPTSLPAVRTDVLRVGHELGANRSAQRLIAAFDAELAVPHSQARIPGPTALYITPGDVTTGPGSLVADVIGAAGFTPYRRTPGWGSLPLEQLVRRPPDAVFRAFFDSPRYQQDFWTASRHPVVAKATQRAVEVKVPGAWLACGNWLTGHAVAALAKARKERG